MIKITSFMQKYLGLTFLLNTNSNKEHRFALSFIISIPFLCGLILTAKLDPQISDLVFYGAYLSFFICILLASQFFKISNNYSITLKYIIIFFGVYAFFEMLVINPRKSSYIDYDILLCMFLSIYVLFYLEKYLILIANKINYIYLSVAIAIILIFIFYTPVIYDTHHHLAHFKTVLLLMEGTPFSDTVVSTYGHYAFFIAPVMNIFGGGIPLYNAILAILFGITFFNFMLVLYNVIDSKLYAFLGLFTCLAFSLVMIKYGLIMYWLNHLHYAVFPLRTFFPSIILLCAVYLKRTLAGYFISSLAILFNPETGLACLVAWAAYDVYIHIDRCKIHYLFFRVLFLISSSIIGSLVLYNILNVFLGGDAQNLQDLLFPLLSVFLTVLDLDWFHVYPWFGLIVLLAGFSYSIQYFKIFNLKSLVNYSHKNALIFMISFLGLLLYAYFINRKAPGNTWLAGFNVFIIFIWIISKCSANNTSILSKFCAKLGTLVLIFFSISCFTGFFLNEPLKKYLSDKHLITEQFVGEKEFIKKNIQNTNNAAVFSSDSLDYAFVELGLVNSLPISDRASFTAIGHANEIIPTMQTANCAELFIGNIQYNDKVKLEMESFLKNNYILIDEDKKNNFYYYVKK